MSRLPPQTMPGKRKRPKSKEMSHSENRQFWFARNIPLLAEEVAARSNKKSRSDLFPRRRGGQFGAILSFAGLLLGLRPIGLALRATPSAPSKEASQYFIHVASSPPLRGGEYPSQTIFE